MGLIKYVITVVFRNVLVTCTRNTNYYYSCYGSSLKCYAQPALIDPPTVVIVGKQVVELDKENQKMVVMCDADNVGWGTQIMGELVEEVNMVLGWSSNKLGTLVLGTKKEFRLSWMLVVLSV